MLDLYFSVLENEPKFVSLIVTTISAEDTENNIENEAEESEFFPYVITVSGTYTNELSPDEIQSIIWVRDSGLRRSSTIGFILRK